MTNIRPAKPKWANTYSGPAAATALGEFTVSQGSDGFWRAFLNSETFPILYDQIEQAKAASLLMAQLAGHPAGIGVDWKPNDAGGVTTNTIAGEYHVIPSESIQGFFVMHGDKPAETPLSSLEEAKEACAQYLVFVWFALSEVV
jgi:hypothetical protein